MNPFRGRRKIFSSSCISKPLRLFNPSRKRLVITGIAFIVFLYIFQNYRETIAHITRPIWDKKPKPWKNVVINYDLTSPEDCEIYGWKPNANHQKTKVIDTFLFNNELDWLEIRLNELNDVVDYFVILEASYTFTNIPKNLVFNETLAEEAKMYSKDNITQSRFLKFKHKILHLMETHKLENVTSAFGREGTYRERMKHELYRIPGGIKKGDIVILADLDEVPRPNVLRITKSCEGWPSPTYLRTRRYLYSFEFSMGVTEHTTLWQYGVGDVPINVGHKRIGDTIIEDAGWHCSFCFKYLEDFVNKMESYSHFDRAKAEHKNLDSIQDKICEGRDLYDRQPMEAYTFKDMVMSYGNIPSHLSAVALPSYVIDNHKKFSYLLPGYCIRLINSAFER